ncbi:hypothetical protein N658DRAFT_507528 [Parathielavia hyrcaniae]|uniref:Uncharacterized protein n=1 Tax=Parathielavia hyrcaniae TaxID=113614 RepID=A0AAN6T1Q7_9PEZI|nr:hypothetical protein N658DRAFT_507528 [Parathielavia hyrcaniae]
MTRQYYCWKVCLTFSCGCTETTPTTHRCGPSREGCNNWMTYKRTDKSCEEHRLLDGWGLLSNSNDNHHHHSAARQAEAGGDTGGASGPAQQSVGAREEAGQDKDKAAVETGQQLEGRWFGEVAAAAAAAVEGQLAGEAGPWEGCYARRRV